ncbi:MAG TPA: hypothetical protein VLD65_10635 [Anaerolineales bacterium]|nr:hypothetical protein [Anaerolineales bacterium]
MRRYFLMIFVLLLLISCGRISFPLIHPRPTVTVAAPFASATIIPASPTTTLLPSITPSPFPSLTPSPIPTSTSSIALFTVYYHPDGGLYVGDQVSFEVVSPPGLDVKDTTVQVRVDPPAGPALGSVKFAAWGIQGRSEATFLWAWDTKTVPAGEHTLAFEVQPQGISWTEQVTLLPASDLPPGQTDAQWAVTTTQCCTVFYITETASERDLPTLTTMVDAQAQDAMAKMGADFTEPITITVLPRLLGHGGFTSSEISVSYLDRNYASTNWALVVHHEMIHAIDAHLGGDFRPTMFVEGLAVYMTGGHYKPESLMPRAAALLDGYLNWYLPLIPLANDFYASQHEIGYLEGASLIEYMIQTYGEQAFFSFYRDIHNQPGESQSDSIDAALQAHFSITFAHLEQDFLAALRDEPDTSTWLEDVRLTVTYYDTMRRYQQWFDPSAYFRTAWLLDNKVMRERGIVEDYLRHPHAPENLALETLFITAGLQMASNDHLLASQTLEQINTVLDGIERGSTDPFSTSSIPADYISICATLQENSYEVQTISLNGDEADTTVSGVSGPELFSIHLKRIVGQWSIVP